MKRRLSEIFALLFCIILISGGCGGGGGEEEGPSTGEVPLPSESSDDLILLLNGSGDKAKGDATVYPFLSAASFTFEAWIYPKAINKMYIASDDAYDVVVDMPNQVIMFALTKSRCEDYYGGYSSGKISMNQWSHIAAGYDQPAGKIYIAINGRVMEIPIEFPYNFCNDTDYHFTVGGSYVTNSASNAATFVGEINNVRVSNVVRYTADFDPTGILLSADDSTMGLWRFNEVTDSTRFADASGNGVHLTAAGGAKTASRSPDVPDNTPPVLTISPSPGSLVVGTEISITANEPALIFYTTDGTDPTISSEDVYTGPITLSDDVTIKYFGVDNADNQSEVQTAVYLLSGKDRTPPTLLITPKGGTFTNEIDVEIESLGESATIYYTTDGTTPTASSGVYSAPIHLDRNTVLKYFAVDSDGNASNVATEEYKIYLMSVTGPVNVSAAEDIYGVAWDGSKLWVLDGVAAAGSIIFEVNTSTGNKVGSNINISDDVNRGQQLEWDGANFWYSAKSPSGRLKKIDSNGNVVNSFTTGGDADFVMTTVIDDGKKLAVLDSWGGDSILKYDLSGNLISSINVATNVFLANAMTWCGGYYWVIGNELYQIGTGNESDASFDPSDYTDAWWSSYVTDATCDDTNKIIWVAIDDISDGLQKLFKVQLPN